MRKKSIRVASGMQREQGNFRLTRWAMIGIGLALFFPVTTRAQQSPAPAFALHAGDRVVFYGDSITAQHRYTRLVEDFVVSRYPEMRIDFYNAGVSGDTVSGGYSGGIETRLKRDVLPWHPTVVTIMLGMNDGRYTTAFDKNFQVYKTGYRTLVDDLKTDLPGVRLTFIRPSPYDEITREPLIPGYNSVLLRYGNFLSQWGAKQGIPVVDFNQPMTDALRAGMKIDPRMAASLLPDRIHPSLAGHWIMAAALARGWNINPIVSSVTLDAARTDITNQQNTTVSGLNETANGLRWTQLDRALPLPLELNNSMTQFLLQISDIGSLDQQMLRVTGLSAASYSLEIDGKKIASFSRQELAGGINLALYSTPMEQQAKSIDWTAQDRAKLSGTRFDLMFEGDKIAGEADAVRVLDTLDQQMIDAEYKNAQPKPHTFALIADGQ
ncbi:MAG: SGNH/GDSL hydrolase family protein [Acidobacteriaceae bacterium]